METTTAPAHRALSNGHLLIIVLAQFAGTSLWFAGNAVLPDLVRTLPGLTGWITSAVQVGFVCGTLLYALLAIPDRFPASRVFVVSVALAAVANIAWLLGPVRADNILASRFFTGFFLAGVYPVGMKIAADWFRPVLGRAMGFLVGALVVGTAFPHLVRGLGATLPYRTILLFVSALSVIGGLVLALFIPSKPTTKQPGGFQFTQLSALFRPSTYRPAMLGYFGHMWELYTLWAFAPMLISLYATQHPLARINVSIWSFGTIAAGAVGCVAGGFWALQSGSRHVARTFLAISGACIALVPWLLSLPPLLFGLFLFIWGLTAAGDSPQFSTLVANGAPVATKGSVITLVVSIGFLITVLSIQTMAWLTAHYSPSVWLFYLLLPGPMLGVWAGRKDHSNG
ncbi:MFS transporter [Fibrella sp. HMF5335]|uniref:MFS transporter n=1 Tax=Fibrella rubiginis TaxID=2817060 RepID=A0A939K549_9BACT|nr:MFS transporter [Fibrella rubiginis]MBO0939099.1 MFS transporter [Fibrella rubiginis]